MFFCVVKSLCLYCVRGAKIEQVFSFESFKCSYKILKKIQQELTKKIMDTSLLAIRIAKTFVLSKPSVVIKRSLIINHSNNKQTAKSQMINDKMATKSPPN